MIKTQNALKILVFYVSTVLRMNSMWSSVALALSVALAVYLAQGMITCAGPEEEEERDRTNLTMYPQPGRNQEELVSNDASLEQNQAAHSVVEGGPSVNEDKDDLLPVECPRCHQEFTSVPQDCTNVTNVHIESMRYPPSLLGPSFTKKSRWQRVLQYTGLY